MPTEISIDKVHMTLPVATNDVVVLKTKTVSVFFFGVSIKKWIANRYT